MSSSILGFDAPGGYVNFAGSTAVSTGATDGALVVGGGIGVAKGINGALSLGDLLVGNGTTISKLTIGSSTFVLASTGGTASWMNPLSIQTPWLGNINAGGFLLTNINEIGTASTASTTGFALGPSADAKGIDSISIGSSSSSTGDNSISIGTLTINSSSGTIIGHNAQGTALNTVVLGNSSSSTGVSSTAIGPLNKSSGINGIIVGSSITSTGNYTTVLGDRLNTTKSSSFIVVASSVSLIDVNSTAISMLSGATAGHNLIYQSGGYWQNAAPIPLWTGAFATGSASRTGLDTAGAVEMFTGGTTATLTSATSTAYLVHLTADGMSMTQTIINNNSGTLTLTAGTSVTRRGVATVTTNNWVTVRVTRAGGVIYWCLR